jgi:hypothetical protein
LLLGGIAGRHVAGLQTRDGQGHSKGAAPLERFYPDTRGVISNAPVAGFIGMILGWLGGSRSGPGKAGKHQDHSGARKYKAGDTIAGIYRVLHVFEGGLGVVYVVEHTTGYRIVL